MNCICILMFLVSISARANDTLASVDAGKLTFGSTDKIAMLSEDLFVSASQIRVKYEFRNESDVEVAGRVAFPLPSFNAEQPYRIDPRDYMNGKDPMNFRVTVEGKPVPVKIEAREVVDEVSGVNHVEVAYHWDQKFPPKKTIQVEHVYNPSTGSGGITPEDAKEYCLDPKFKKSYAAIGRELAKKMSGTKTKTDYGTVENRSRVYMHFHSVSRVGYILKTANNWKGPIGRFRLTVDKGEPSTLLGTCFPGLKSNSGTRVVADFKDYRPDADLSVVFVGRNYDSKLDR